MLRSQHGVELWHLVSMFVTAKLPEHFRVVVLDDLKQIGP